MTRGQRKEEIVTFKVDQSLLKALEAVPNRSEFIRSALMAALVGMCPLCAGTGVLTPNQRRHWEEFAGTHAVERCENCRELRLVCSGKTGR